MSIARACIIASAAICVTLTDASAQSREMPLGCYTIGSSGPDVGTIRVDLPGNPRFRAIRLQAIGATVTMFGMKVTFPNDKVDNVSVDGLRIAAGARSGELDLEGTAHEVREIELSFDASPFERNKRICAVGLVASGTPRNWVELGCHIVDFSSDYNSERDKFRVSNPNALVESLRINVRENTVRVRQFTVRYRGGRSEELGSKVEPREIKKDRRSRRIRLTQGPQRIFEISLNYALIENVSVNGRAVACIEGLEVPGTPAPPAPPSLDQAGPPPDGWDRLGCEVVWPAGGGGRFNVNNDRDRFSAVQAQAFVGNIRVERLDITPIRGNVIHTQPFPVRKDAVVARYFDDGPLNIRTIEIVSKATDGSEAAALICLNGRKFAEGAGRDPPDNQTGWKEIGCQPADTRPEFDVYQVGRDEGPFRAIRFKAKYRDVWLRSFKIVFENGDEETISTREGNEIRLSDIATSPVDLLGERRTISRIVMYYRSASDYRDAEVCIEGRTDRSRTDDGGSWRRQPISDQPWQRRR